MKGRARLLRPLWRGVQAIRSRLRRKLLALVLFPILLIVPVALLLTLWWGTRFTYDQLFFKVNTDLSVAHDAFLDVQHDYLMKLELLGESYRFRTALASGPDADVEQQLKRLRDSGGFSYLRLVDRDGQPLLGSQPRLHKPSPLWQQALRGQPASGVEIFANADLAVLSPALAQTVKLPLVATPRARPSTRWAIR
jgi:two-component system NtrC family sensor kinase